MKKMVKGLSLVLVCVLVAGITVPVSAAKKMKLSRKETTLKVGQKKKLEVKNAAKKVKWSVKSGKKYISLSGKKKTSVVVKAKKQGKAAVLAKIGRDLSVRLLSKKQMIRNPVCRQRFRQLR